MAREQVKRKTSIGGQALIEGVMMRGPERTAMAVRHTDGTIRTDSWTTAGSSRPKVLKLPFVRGIFNFVDSMTLGFKCLMQSVEMSGLEEELTAEDAGRAKPDKAEEAVPPAEADPFAEATPSAEEDPSAEVNFPVEEIAATEDAPMDADGPAAEEKDAPARKEDKGKGLMAVLMTVSSLLGVALAVVLFIWLPTQAGRLLSGPLPFLEHRVGRAVFEGVLRILLFVGYVALVSLMKDIKRVFMYHGAEHKTIFCYEKQETLTVENVRRQSRYHPRCGTSFMIFMLLVGIVVGIFIPVSIPVWLRTGIKLLTIPLVVGIGYELIKLAGRSDNIVVRILSAPGLWLQRITTREPTDDMIEVAIASFAMVVPAKPEADTL